MSSKTMPASRAEDDGAERKTVLIVDDEVDIVTIFSMLFELHGFQVATASNGMEALDIVIKRSPDVIVSDCMMPIMNGLEFCRQIRRNPATRTIPIVLMSAAQASRDLTGAGHDVFLRKPFDFNVLLAEISTLMGSRYDTDE